MAKVTELTLFIGRTFSNPDNKYEPFRADVGEKVVLEAGDDRVKVRTAMYKRLKKELVTIITRIKQEDSE